ncbi:MAG: helix-turn-helix domain-containing protein [Sneathiella sp.]|nr:helix-turn-helix domain-containing protein [Sneathiella sp.]
MSSHKNVIRDATITIGTLAKKTGVNLETIRYYERIGVMPKPPRSAAGHRIYDHDHLKHLSFIKRSRELGFTLDEVRALLRLVDRGDYSCDEVRTLTLQHRTDVQTKIKDLQRLEATLTEISDKCIGGCVPECPIIEALYSDGTEGA